jgi:gamma-glutamyltranspeptidase/glutathione hydrolase
MPHIGIAAGSQIAADAGAAIANQGGNAVDAAIAATLVAMCTDIGVMAPGASGFITIWPPDRPPVVIDGYAAMPGLGLPSDRIGQGAMTATFDYGGEMSTLIGYGAVATPGIFAALEMASQRYGSLPWADVVEPARHWIAQGFPLSGGAAEYLTYTHQAIFSWHPDSYRTLYDANGRCLQAGEKVYIPSLAESLSLIGEQGTSSFYTGELGHQIAAEIQAHAGLLTAEDLATYQPIARAPLRFHFKDWEIITNPPPAIGGTCLAAILALLNHLSFEEWDPDFIQQFANIQRIVLDYRYHYFTDSDPTAIAIAQILESASFRELQAFLTSPSTIHISTVDSQGLACSITASAGYGSGVMISGTGLWFNNSLGELELNTHGTTQATKLFTPGNRLISNMAPTIARHPNGSLLSIGSPGASRITTAIAQVLMNTIHLGMSLPDAIDHSRLHVEICNEAATIAFEAGLAIESVQEFETRCFPQRSMYFGGVNAALWDSAIGQVEGAADPRRTGGVAYGGKP